VVRNRRVITAPAQWPLRKRPLYVPIPCSCNSPSGSASNDAFAVTTKDSIRMFLHASYTPNTPASSEAALMVSMPQRISGRGGHLTVGNLCVILCIISDGESEQHHPGTL